MTIDLRRAILDEPASIAHLAVDLTIPRIAYVPPKYYRKAKPHRFDRDKAESNLLEISTICNTADWIVCDLEDGKDDDEKKSRDILRHDDRHSNEDIVWASRTHVEMWDFFREHWPSAKLSEYNLANGKSTDITKLSLADQLVIHHLDAFDVRTYWTENLPRTQRILTRAKLLAARYNKPLITWVWESSKAGPLDYDQIVEMLELGLSPGVDIAVLWSNIFQDRAVTPENTANVVRLMAEMRLKVEQANG